MNPWISDALADDEAEIGPRREHRLVVLGDHAAHRHAGERIELLEHRLLHLAADIFEIGVDAVGALGAQFGPQIVRAMIDAGVEAEAVLHPQAFFRPAGDADHAGAGPFGELPGDRAHGARGGGNDHGLAGFRLADLGDAGVGGRARHAEHAEIGRQRRAMALDLHQVIALGDVVRLPAARPDGDIADGEAGMVGGDDLAHGFAGHDLADLNGDGVGLLLAQPAAHIRVDREPDRSRHHLARARRRDRVLLDFEVRGARVRRAGGASGRPSGGWSGSRSSRGLRFQDEAATMLL